MGSFEILDRGAGEQARLYLASPGPSDAAPGRAGVVVLHPWWGLNGDVIAYCDRLASAGFTVAAPDLFDGKVAATIEDADALSNAADEAVVGQIVLAAVDRLSQRLGPDRPVAVLGFSFGAAWAIWAPTKRPALRATVVYYGTWAGSILNGTTVPVLGHFAETDPYETPERVSEFEKGLADAGREAATYQYPGTSHWFAEPSRPEYRREAAELAFERTTSFLESHLGRPVS